MITPKAREFIEWGQNRALQEEGKLTNRIYLDLSEGEPRGIVYGMLAEKKAYQGFYSLYLDQDVASCKQWFYLASRLREESCKYSGGWSLDAPDNFIFALLSDSPAIVQRFSVLDTVNLDHPEHCSFKEAYLQPSLYDRRYLVHYLQAMMRGDWVLANQIKDIAAKKIKKQPEFVKYWFAFGDALQEGNTEAMDTMINTLLKPRVHKAWNKDNVYELNGAVWSHHPTMFTKLAWMHGYELHIDNPLVPMALMPVRPLDNYDDVYDFLKSDFDPRKASSNQTKGFWSRWFGGK